MIIAQVNLFYAVTPDMCPNYSILVCSRELSEEDKRKFLLFLTGSDRIPARGMECVRVKIQRTGDDSFLPVAHTCFNLLDLPEYQTKEKLKYKLIQAIQQTKGFGIV